MRTPLAQHARPPVDEQGRLRAAFLAAVALTLLAFAVPHGEWALYPFVLLGTWAHELGHGLTALLVGGEFRHLELYADGSGRAYSAIPVGRLASALVSAGGLVGPAIAGGLTLIFGARPRLAPVLLYLFVGLLALSAVLWVRNLFGLIAVGGLGVLLALVARFGALWLERLVFQLIGVQLCLASLRTVDYMFTRTATIGGRTQLSDTGAIAEQLFLPYWFWGALIAAFSFAVLGLSFWWAWIRPSPSPSGRISPGERG